MNPTNYGQPAPSAKESFKTFEDLEVYRLAREFRKAMYGVTRRLPAFEKFELASQIRRAAVSLTNNLAEGHGRFHYLEQIRFTLISRGSLEELIDDLNVCEDEKYLPSAEISDLKQQAWQIHRVMAGYSATSANASRVPHWPCTKPHPPTASPKTTWTYF